MNTNLLFPSRIVYRDQRLNFFSWLDNDQLATREQYISHCEDMVDILLPGEYVTLADGIFQIGENATLLLSVTFPYGLL